MAKDDFKKLEEDVIEFFNKIKMQLSFPIALKIVFQSASKQKHLIKITKVPDHYAAAFDVDLLVQINPTYFDNFDEDINNILIEQELAGIEFNLDKGTFKLVKPDFATTFGMVSKYKISDIQRAIETEKLFGQQKEENND